MIRDHQITQSSEQREKCIAALPHHQFFNDKTRLSVNPRDAYLWQSYFGGKKGGELIAPNEIKRFFDLVGQSINGANINGGLTGCGTISTGLNTCRFFMDLDLKTELSNERVVSERLNAFMLRSVKTLLDKLITMDGASSIYKMWISKMKLVVSASQLRKIDKKNEDDETEVQKYKLGIHAIIHGFPLFPQLMGIFGKKAVQFINECEDKRMDHEFENYAGILDDQVYSRPDPKGGGRGGCHLRLFGFDKVQKCMKCDDPNNKKEGYLNCRDKCCFGGRVVVPGAAYTQKDIYKFKIDNHKQVEIKKRSKSSLERYNNVWSHSIIADKTEDYSPAFMKEIKRTCLEFCKIMLTNEERKRLEEATKKQSETAWTAENLCDCICPYTKDGSSKGKKGGGGGDGGGDEDSEQYIRLNDPIIKNIEKVVTEAFGSMQDLAEDDYIISRNMRKMAFAWVHDPDAGINNIPENTLGVMQVDGNHDMYWCGEIGGYHEILGSHHAMNPADICPVREGDIIEIRDFVTGQITERTLTKQFVKSRYFKSVIGGYGIECVAREEAWVDVACDDGGNERQPLPRDIIDNLFRVCNEEGRGLVKLMFKDKYDIVVENLTNDGKAECMHAEGQISHSSVQPFSEAMPVNIPNSISRNMYMIVRWNSNPSQPTYECIHHKQKGVAVHIQVTAPVFCMKTTAFVEIGTRCFNRESGQHSSCKGEVVFVNNTRKNIRGIYPRCQCKHDRHENRRHGLCKSFNRGPLDETTQKYGPIVDCTQAVGWVDMSNKDDVLLFSRLCDDIMTNMSSDYEIRNALRLAGPELRELCPSRYPKEPKDPESIFGFDSVRNLYCTMWKDNGTKVSFVFPNFAPLATSLVLDKHTLAYGSPVFQQIRDYKTAVEDTVKLVVPHLSDKKMPWSEDSNDLEETGPITGVSVHGITGKVTARKLALLFRGYAGIIEKRLRVPERPMNHERLDKLQNNILKSIVMRKLAKIRKNERRKQKKNISVPFPNQALGMALGSSPVAESVASMEEDKQSSVCFNEEDERRMLMREKENNGEDCEADMFGMLPIDDDYDNGGAGGAGGAGGEGGDNGGGGRVMSYLESLFQ